MNLKYALLGLIQGITEPIPISSSGHLRIFQQLFNVKSIDLNFEIIVNFGSLIAILIIFRKDLIRLVKSFFTYIFTSKKKETKIDFKYCLLIIVGSIPIGIIGFLLKDFVESKLSNINILGISFIITALALYLVRNLNGKKNDQDITYKDAIIIGLLQVLAIFPGISRSGITLVGCLLRDLKREAALKYTFMLYIPVSLATFGLGIYDLTTTGELSSIFIPYTIGLVISFIGTLISYKWLSNIVKNGKLIIFAIYCLILSGIVFILL